MRRAAWMRAAVGVAAAGAASLALGSCGERRCQSYPCGQQTTCVRYQTVVAANAAIEFEGCGPDGCGDAVTVVSGGRIGPSYHSSEHALWLNAGGEARLRFVLSRASTGSALSFVARCDRGARLRASSPAPRTEYDVQFSTGTTWRNVRQTLVSPSLVTVSAPAELTVREVVLRVEGTGTCQMDRARYDAVDLVCTWSVVTVTQCETCEYRSPGSAGNTGYDWGQRIDAGRPHDAGVDARTVDVPADADRADTRAAPGDVSRDVSSDDVATDGSAEDALALDDVRADAVDDTAGDASVDADANGAEDATADGADVAEIDAGG